MRCHSLCMHAQLSSRERGIKFDLSHIQPPYSVRADSEGSGILAFADRIYDKSYFVQSTLISQPMGF